MELNNFKGKQNTIAAALQLSFPDHAVISFTGSGGKTSLIFAMARELMAAGKRVCVTTTTHMWDPCFHDSDTTTGGMYENVSVIYDSDEPGEVVLRAEQILNRGGIAFVAAKDFEKQGKVKAPSPAVMEALRETADAMLIEADGSRRMPLKWPAPHEPVVPDYTDMTVYVVGLSSVGKPVSDVMYRSDDVPERLKRDTVDVNFLHKVISSRDGGQKGVRGDFRVFLNQVDDDIDRLAAAYRLQQILSVLGIQSAWGSLHDPEIPHCGPKQTAGACKNDESGCDDDNSVIANSSQGVEIAVILEAAGNSTRFGSNKLLHIMDDGRPMASCIMDSVCDAIKMIDTPPGGRRVSFKKILVTQYEEVAELAPDFNVVMNYRPDLGISRSMQLGIEAAGDADAYMFCVCDQPYLKPDTICNLIHAYEKGTAGIVSLAWQGKMCNPKIFSSKYKGELMSLSGDTGGRQIIAAHMHELKLVEAQTEDEVRDIDAR